MIQKATPRPVTGTQHNQTAPHHKRLIAGIVPRSDLAADYVVMAAMLHHPDLAAPYVARLHPGDWITDLHRIMARIALAHLRAIGRVDHRQFADVLHDAGTIRSELLRIELATLARVSELICTDGIVADAVVAVTAHRRGVVA